jgi:NADH-quinone oxidoreductase subunit L
LEPVLGHPHVHVSGAVEALLMASSVLAGAFGIGLAYYMYRLKPALPGLVAQRLQGVYRLLLNKYYIDELYDAVIVKPTLAFSRGVILRIVDLACIEGVVNGLPRAIGTFAERLRRLQDGQVSHYLAWMGGGAVALMAVLLFGL